MSDVTVRHLSDTSISVTWRRLSLLEARGIVTGYTVLYRPSEQQRKQAQQIMVGPDEGVVVITGLVAEVVYSVSVQVATTGGISVSDDITVLPGEASGVVDNSCTASDCELRSHKKICTFITVSTPSNNTTLIIGVIVATVVAILVLAITAVVIVWLILRHRRSMVSLLKGNK